MKQVMKIAPAKCVAFTGHRILQPTEADLFTDYSDGGAHNSTQFEERLREQLSRQIAILHKEGLYNYLCGMAEGFDLLAGEVVVQMQDVLPQLRLIAVIPFPGQNYGFSDINKERYARLLTHSSECFTICDQYERDCFHRRNDFLIDHSSVLISFYNGSKGGTSYTVKRAIREGLRIFNLC